MDTWYNVLGELQFIDITLPGARGLFKKVQESLYHVIGNRVTMIRSVQDDLADFFWLVEDLSACPTRLLKLVPLNPTLTGNNDASGYM